MSFEPSDSLNSFVPNDLIIPDTFDEAKLILTDYIRQLVDALNDKDIAQYTTEAIVNGQKFFTSGDANQFRYVYRKVVNFGALPNATSDTAAHGITTTANTVFTRIYGVATDPGASSLTRSIPIPYVDPNVLANGIELYVDSTNVNIVTAADYSSYTTCYVILEYIENAP